MGMPLRPEVYHDTGGQERAGRTAAPDRQRGGRRRKSAGCLPRARRTLRRGRPRRTNLPGPR
eukprot:664296-Pyramimonas_sp.AAC.1